MAFATEKVAVAAPMPTASVTSATRVNAGDRRAERSAKRTSRARLIITWEIGSCSNVHHRDARRDPTFALLPGTFQNTQRDWGSQRLDVGRRSDRDGPQM